MDKYINKKNQRNTIYVRHRKNEWTPIYKFNVTYIFVQIHDSIINIKSLIDIIIVEIIAKPSLLIRSFLRDYATTGRSSARPSHSDSCWTCIGRETEKEAQSEKGRKGKQRRMYQKGMKNREEGGEEGRRKHGALLHATARLRA